MWSRDPFAWAGRECGQRRDGERHSAPDTIGMQGGKRVGYGRSPIVPDDVSVHDAEMIENGKRVIS